MLRFVTVILLSQFYLFAQNLKVVDQWGEGGASAMIRHDNVFFTVGAEHGLTAYLYDKGLFTVLGEAVFTSRLGDEAGTFHTLAYYDQKVFAGSSKGLFCFDVSNLNQPVPLKQYFLGNILQIVTMGDQLVVLRSRDIQFFDLNSPTLELQASVALQNGQAFLIESGIFWVVDSEGLKHVDLTNPVAPQLNLVYAMTQLNGPLLQYYNHLLVPKGSDLAVFDIANPQSPIFQHTTPTEIAPVTNLVQAPGGLFVLGGSQGKGTCRYFSVDVDYQLEPVYRLHLLGKRGQMQRVDGKLVFTSTTNGLVILTEDPGSAPELMAEGIFSEVCGLEMDGTIGYVSDSNGINVIDLNSTGSIRQLHQFGPGSSKISLTGGTLVSAVSNQTMDTYNVTDPLNPQITDSATLNHDVTQLKANDSYVGVMDPSNFTLADISDLGHSITYTDYGRNMSFSFDANRLRIATIWEFPNWCVASSIVNGIGCIPSPELASDILDLQTKNGMSLAVGKDLTLFDVLIYQRSIEDVDSSVVRFDGSAFWLDGLGYGSFGDVTNIGVRRFEIQQQGTLAALNNRGLVQEGDKISLYDLSEMDEPQLTQVDLPNKVLRVFRSGHDLWVSVPKGIYHVSDQSGRLEQLNYFNFSNFGIRDAVVQGNIAYVINSSGLGTYDISNPENPIKLDEIHLYKSLHRKISFTDDGQLIVYLDSLLVKCDISDPENIQITATADFYPESDIITDGEFIYFSSLQYIVTLNQVDLTLVSLTQMPSYVGAIVKIGDLIYFYDISSFQIAALDVANPANPQVYLVSDIVAGDYIYSDGSKIYALDWFKRELVVYDASDPLHLTPLETFENVHVGDVVAASPEGLYLCRNKGYSLTRLISCSDASDLPLMIPNWPTNSILDLISTLQGSCIP